MGKEVEEVQSDKVTKSDSINKNEALEVVSDNVKQFGSVYDAETKEFVKVSNEQRELAQFLHNVVQRFVLDTALILKRISDEKLYLALGASSFKEYAENHLTFSYRTAKDYLAVGRKFAPYLPELSLERAPGALSEKEGVQNLEKLGIKKLLELSKIEDADFTEVISKGVVKLDDGTELDLDEINSSTSKDFKERIEEYRKYNADLEAELDKLAKERDKALADAEQASKDSETGKKYKDLYGPRSKEYESFKSRIAVARNRALDLNQSLSQVKDLPAEEFEALRDELRDLHKLIDRGLTALREDNMESFMNISQD
ncbi:MAG: hypothetical protein ABJ387_03650 [Balneola sp.]